MSDADEKLADPNGRNLVELNEQQQKVLAFLGEKGESKTAEITEATGVTPAVVQRLQRKGYLTVSIRGRGKGSGTPGRIYWYAVAPEGPPPADAPAPAAEKKQRQKRGTSLTAQVKTKIEMDARIAQAAMILFPNGQNPEWNAFLTWVDTTREMFQ